MTTNGIATSNSLKTDSEYLLNIFEKSDRLLIKKLSNNDRLWAQNGNHQAGPYIPQEQRDGGFFRALKIKEREGAGNKEIREAFFKTVWPQLNIEKQSRLVHYSSKGQETHMTRLPKEAFQDLLPASFLVIGRILNHSEPFYECLTINSDSDEAAFLQDKFNLQPEFFIGEFVPKDIRIKEHEEFFDFADRVIKAWLTGDITRFAIEQAAMPITVELARMAREVYLKKKGIDKIDPFILDAPGDALREISRDIEWGLFKNFQKRERSVELIRKILGDNPVEFTSKDFIRVIIDKFSEVDAILLSASQQRKSRAGYSYEHHIEAMLSAGKIPYAKQVVIESKKRPDFILPSLEVLDNKRNITGTGLILSAKTTLRERWKQVEREKKDRKLFLTTVDENIAGNTIDEMESMGIQLVIPESLMKSDTTEYNGHKNVITFKDFCELHVKPNLEIWRSMSNQLGP